MITGWYSTVSSVICRRISTSLERPWMAAALSKWPDRRAPKGLSRISRRQGIQAMRLRQKERASDNILVLTVHSGRSMVEEAFRAGASGIVLKACKPEEFVTAVQFVAKGTTYITPLLAGDLISSLMKAEPEVKLA